MIRQLFLRTERAKTIEISDFRGMHSSAIVILRTYIWVYKRRKHAYIVVFDRKYTSLPMFAYDLQPSMLLQLGGI